MKEHTEIEYKILLTKEMFNKIIEDYSHFEIHDYIQTNYYLTHPLLLRNKYMLRIREKNGYYELTLKRPKGLHQLETNVIISKEEKEMILNHLPYTNEILEILSQEGIEYEDIQQQFSLTTHRYDIIFNEGVLSLDHNTYLGQEDYELEFEVNNEITGYNKFMEIIQPYHLEYKKNCKSKIKRVLDSI